jgi:molybdate transport system substrate-binding protein
MTSFTSSAATLNAAESKDAIALLSAGAIEPGLRAAVAAFERDTGHAVAITFNTAPRLRERLQNHPAFDVVIAPPGVIAEFGALMSGTWAELGRVGSGVAVRDGAELPDVSTADKLKRALLDAESVVFNRASTGLYLETLIRKMDIEAQVQAKATRYPNGASVLEHVIAGKGREIGVGALTEILLYQGKGLTLVGPMPPEVQNYTDYTAAPLASSSKQALAQQLVSFLAGPMGKPLFVAAGVTS